VAVQGRADVTASRRAQMNPVDDMQPIGGMSLTLPPGRYELVCNLENHWANGWWPREP